MDQERQPQQRSHGLWPNPVLPIPTLPLGIASQVALEVASLEHAETAKSFGKEKEG